jgi:hypothetical protein
MKLSQPVDLEIYGCTLEQWKIVRGDPKIRFDKCAIQKWKMQKRNAALRGIEWNFSLWDWWKAWQGSGRWEDRGCKAHQYCMCRKGDIGPYAVGNVYFATASTNLSDARRSGKSRKKNIRGVALGVEVVKRNTNRPYRAVYAKKRVGSFQTFEEARAAYLQARSEAIS